MAGAEVHLTADTDLTRRSGLTAEQIDRMLHRTPPFWARRGRHPSLDTARMLLERGRAG